MRAPLLLAAAAALAAADALPPVGHGGPLDDQRHPQTAGSAAGAEPALSRPLDPADITGFADEPEGAPRPEAPSPLRDARGDVAGSGRDRDLIVRIRSALIADGDLEEGISALHLVARDGVVTLQGSVESPAVADRVRAIVGEQEGVKRVDDHLGVGAR